MLQVSTMDSQVHFKEPAATVEEVNRLLDFHANDPTPPLIEITGAGRVTDYPVLTLARVGRFGTGWWDRFDHATARRRRRTKTGTAFRHLDGTLVWVPGHLITLRPADLRDLLARFLAEDMSRPEIRGIMWDEGPVVTRSPRRTWIPDLAGAPANAWFLRALAGRCTGLASVLFDLGPVPADAAGGLGDLFHALNTHAVTLDATDEPTPPSAPALVPVLPPAPDTGGGLAVIKVRTPVAADELRNLLADISVYLDRYAELGNANTTVEAINDCFGRLAPYPVLLERWAMAL